MRPRHLSPTNAEVGGEERSSPTRVVNAGQTSMFGRRYLPAPGAESSSPRLDHRRSPVSQQVKETVQEMTDMHNGGNFSSSAGLDLDGAPGGHIDHDEAYVQLLVYRVLRRILPYVFMLALFAYFDRANLSFAAMPMRAELGLSEAEYGLGSSIFFLTYILCQIPSVQCAASVGAPKWLAFIMSSWGLCAALFAFLPEGKLGARLFFGLRLLLGAAEAGAFPTMWLYVSRWCNPDELTLAWCCVAGATAVSGVLGGPLAACLLSLDGMWGLPGWRWLFLSEGVVTIGLAGLALVLLPSSLEGVWWLSAEEKQAFRAGRCLVTTPKKAASPRLALRDWRVVYLSAVWFLTNCQYNAILYWLPTFIHALLPENESVAEGEEENHHSGAALASALTCLPYFCSSVAMFVNAWHSKRTAERNFHCGMPLLLGGIGFAALPFLSTAPPLFGLISLIFAVAGGFAMQPPMWSWSAVWMEREGTSDAIAGAATAVINTMGNIGGLVGPALVGVLAKPETESADGSQESGLDIDMRRHALSLHLLGTLAAIGGIMALGFRPIGKGHGEDAESGEGNLAELATTSEDVGLRGARA